MPWHKITLTDTQRLVSETEELVDAFQKVYDRYRSRVANMALFGMKGDDYIFFFNASASSRCNELIRQYSAVAAKPSKHLHRIAGEVGPQIFES